MFPCSIRKKYSNSSIIYCASRMRARGLCRHSLRGCNPHCNKSLLKIIQMKSMNRVLHQFRCAPLPPPHPPTFANFRFGYDVLHYVPIWPMVSFCLHDVEVDACLAACFCFPCCHVACNVLGPDLLTCGRPFFKCWCIYTIFHLHLFKYRYVFLSLF